MQEEVLEISKQAPSPKSKKRPPVPSNNSAPLFTKRQICFNRCGFYLPFIITHSLIIYLFLMYVTTYLTHLIGQDSYWTPTPNHAEKTRGIAQTVVLLWLVFWLEVCLYRAVFTHPGIVPPNSENADFDYDQNGEADQEEQEEEDSRDLASDENKGDTISEEVKSEGAASNKTHTDFNPSSIPHEPEPRDEPDDDSPLMRKTTELLSVRHTAVEQEEEDKETQHNLLSSGVFLQSESQSAAPVPVKQESTPSPPEDTIEVVSQGQGQQKEITKSPPPPLEIEIDEEHQLLPPKLPNNMIRFHTIEKDKDGYNRFCKFCLHSKPDRSHHCKVCGTCILKMDHHCPWILNCVGFHNYKYFLMLLLYSGLSCLLISTTYWESVFHASASTTVGFSYLYSLFVAFFLALVLAIVLLSFLTFHLVWLLFPNFTTIEFCEKRKDPSSVYSSYSPFSHGCKANFYATMGRNCLFWFFPFKSEKSGNHAGLEFPYNERYRRQYLQD